jgi:Tfp pilus assembly protein PilX
MDVHRGSELVTRSRRSPHTGTRDETGATLVLALMFMVVIAVIVGSLAMASGNDILNIGNFKTSRASLSAAEGAIQSQMSSMRYSYATSCPGTPYTLNGATIVVTCTTTVNPASSASRVVNFTAVPQGQSSTTLIAALVTYDDFSSSFNKNDCLASTPSPTTCGSGMTVNSWVIRPGGG